jgi:hypothetical protein
VTTDPLEAMRADTAEPFPWPPPAGGTALGQLVETWQRSVFQPAGFFAAMPRRSGLGAAIVYYLIIGTVAAAIRLFWRFALPPFLPDGDALVLRALRMGQPDSPLVEFLLAPMFMLLTLGLATVVTHGALWIVGGARERMGTTAAVYAYSNGPQLFVVVPVVGTALGTLWALVLLVIGLREAHRTTTGRAIMALVLPLLGVALLFVLLFVALLLLGGAGMLVPELPG